MKNNYHEKSYTNEVSPTFFIFSESVTALFNYYKDMLPENIVDKFELFWDFMMGELDYLYPLKDYDIIDDKLFRTITYRI